MAEPGRTADNSGSSSAARTGHDEPVLPPSRFGAGYTVGGPPETAPAVYGSSSHGYGATTHDSHPNGYGATTYDSTSYAYGTGHPLATPAAQPPAVIDQGGTVVGYPQDPYAAAVGAPPGATVINYNYVNPPARGSNTLATVAFVLVLFFGAFVVPFTIPMGHIARSQIKRTGESGGGLALATLIISYIYLAVGLFLLITILGAAHQAATYSPY
jgi:hypothetical protein